MVLSTIGFLPFELYLTLLSYKRFFLGTFLVLIMFSLIKQMQTISLSSLAFAAYVGYLPLFLFALICYVFFPDARTLLF